MIFKRFIRGFNKEKLFIEYAGSSDIGLVRTENQDSYGIFTSSGLNLDSERGHLFVVADGMGGHVGGKEASSLAVSTINEIYANSISSNSTSLVKEAIETANKKIFVSSKESEIYNRMGTTCSVFFLKNNLGSIGHVGDSRIYKVENDTVEQLTTDHTKVNELLKEGIITKQEAVDYPAKSILSRALGVNEKVKIDYLENIRLKEGQIYILCTDGLSNVSENEFMETVISSEPKDACDKLISLANQRGGKDNATVLVIKIVSKI